MMPSSFSASFSRSWIWRSSSARFSAEPFSCANAKYRGNATIAKKRAKIAKNSAGREKRRGGKRFIYIVYRKKRECANEKLFCLFFNLLFCFFFRLHFALGLHFGDRARNEDGRKSKKGG